MKTLVFVRHAESIANAGGMAMPNALIPLSVHGHGQAQRLAEAIGVAPAAVLVSAFLRTQETAQPYCERHSVRPVVHPLLHEFRTIDAALIAGLDFDQRRLVVDAYWDEANPDKRMGDDAETFHEFAARVAHFELKLNDLPDGTVIFGHGMWLALLVWRLLGASTRGSRAMRRFRPFQLALPIPNCAIYALRSAGEGTCVRTNERM